MRYASVCSGVEAASLAWMPLGWQPAFFAEVEPFPCAVLKAHYPDVPNLGDITRIDIQQNGDIHYGTGRILGNDDAAIDIIIGGTPCQAASTAGNRAGLIEGTRSRLAFTFTRLAYELAAYRGCKWLVWENVPGVFSLNGGRDFAAFLSSLAGRDIATPSNGWGNAGIIFNATAGNYGLAYRVLDVQYTRVDGFPFAIPQRRRRVFLIGYFGDWERAAKVLFEPGGLQGNTPPSRKTRQEIAASAGRCTAQADVMPGMLTIGIGNGQVNEALISKEEVCQTLNCMADVQKIAQVYSIDAKASNSWKSANPNSGIHGADVARTLDTTVPDPQKNQGGQIVLHSPDCDTQTAICIRMREGCEGGGKGPLISEDKSLTLGCGNDQVLCAIDAQQSVLYGNKAGACDTVHQGLENVICFNGGSFGGRKAESISGPVTTQENTCRGDTKIICENAIAIAGQCINRKPSHMNGLGISDDGASPTCTTNDIHAVGSSACVRRLMPVETERLMGFPDGYTIPKGLNVTDELVEQFIEIFATWAAMTSSTGDARRKSPKQVRAWLEKIRDPQTCPDSSRYKCCGNSFGVNCVRWLGLRIDATDAAARAAGDTQAPGEAPAP